MRTAHQTAILLAILLNRSGQTRARVSAKTIKLLGGRRNLRIAFVAEVIDALHEYGWALFELGNGGYGAVRASALEAAKSVTVRRGFTDDERNDLRRGVLDWPDLESEAAPDQDQQPDDED